MSIVVCQMCDEKFEEWSTYDGRPHQRIQRKNCSPRCAQQWDARLLKARLRSSKRTSKPCVGCGEAFETQDLRRRFCSPECNAKTRMAAREAILRAQTAECWCGEIFHKRVALSGSTIFTNNVRRYCSVEHGHLWRTKKRERPFNEDRLISSKQCPCCDEEFDPRLTYEGIPRLKGKIRDFCSLKCLSRFNQIAREQNGSALATRLSTLYGLTVAQYTEMIEAQTNICAICGEPPGTSKAGKPQRLAIDHDHASGQVRGLLCGPCNQALGLFRDRTDRMLSALEYLLGPEEA